MNRGAVHSIWKVFNLRTNTIVSQFHQTDIEQFELACTDFSNIDDPDERYVVIRKNKSRTHDDHIIYFDQKGRFELEATIPAQKPCLKEKFEIEAVRKDNNIIDLAYNQREQDKSKFINPNE